MGEDFEAALVASKAAWESTEAYNQLKKAVVDAFEEFGMAKSRVTDRHIPKESEITLTVQPNTPKDTEVYAEVTPPDGYILKIRYFKLTTPKEIQGNILLTGTDGEEVRMLKDNQAEDLADQLYDHSDWDAEAFFLQKFRLYGIVTADPATTTSWNIVVKYSGTLVKYKV